MDVDIETGLEFDVLQEILQKEFEENKLKILIEKGIDNYKTFENEALFIYQLMKKVRWIGRNKKKYDRWINVLRQEYVIYSDSITNVRLFLFQETLFIVHGFFAKVEKFEIFDVVESLNIDIFIQKVFKIEKERLENKDIESLYKEELLQLENAIKSGSGFTERKFEPSYGDIYLKIQANRNYYYCTEQKVGFIVSPRTTLYKKTYETPRFS